MPVALREAGGRAVRARRLRDEPECARAQHLASARTVIPAQPVHADPHALGSRGVDIDALELTGTHGLLGDIPGYRAIPYAADIVGRPRQPPCRRSRLTVLADDARLRAL